MRIGIFFLTMVGCCGAVFAQDTVMLKSTVMVTTNSVRLGDIADIASDHNHKKTLEDIVISPAPMAGQQRTLTPNDVMVRLRMQNVDVSDLSIAGAPLTVVARKSRLISGEAIVDAVRAKMDAGKPADADVIFEISRAPSDVFLVDKPFEMQIEMPGMPSENETVNVGVSIMQDSALVNRVQVPVSVRVFREVAVSNRDLAKGDRISAADIVMQKEELVSAVKGAFGSPNDLVGKEMTQSIPQGRVIIPRMVEAPLAVKRGSHVTMVYEFENLRITAIVVAKQDGRSGDVITVTNMNTKKDLSARVESAGSVRFVY